MSDEAQTTLKSNAVRSVLWASGYGASLMSPAMCLAGIIAFMAGIGGHVMALPMIIAYFLVLLWAVSYYRMALKMPKCGSHYAYVFSEMGFWPAWLVWAFVANVYALGPIPVLLIIYLYVSPLIPSMPLWLMVIIVEILVTWVSIRGIRLASGAAFALFMTETLIILSLCATLFYQYWNTVPDLGAKMAASFNLSFASSGLETVGLVAVMTAALFGTWNFLGFASITTIVEESSPKIVAKGIILAVTIVAAIYVIATTIIPIIWWDNMDVLAKLEDPLAEAGKIAWGGGWILILFAVVLSCFTCLLACQNAGPRIFYDMARDGVIPDVFGKLHQNYQTPVIGLIVVAVATGLGAIILPLVTGGIMDGMMLWISMQAVTFLAAYILVAMSNIKAFWNDNSLTGILLSKLFPVLGIIAAAYLIFTSGAITLIWGGANTAVWMVVGYILWLKNPEKMKQLALESLS